MKESNMAGRKPKPTNLKILEGNPGKRPLNLAEPQPERGAICPDWLSDRGQQEWQRLASILENCGILTAADQNTLAAYCEAFANYVNATQKVQRLDSLVEKGSHGTKVAAIVNAQRIYADQMLKWGSKLGLSASDRTGLKVTDKPKTGKWASKITA
jgi:P27 family predicted phage terminase small subunit